MRNHFYGVPLWGADGSDDGEGSDDDQGSGEASQEESRTLTSKELESMTARAASRASRKAVNKLRDDLGFDSVDDMKSFITGKREADEEAKSDQDKAITEAQAAAKEAADEKIAASALRRSVMVERQIVRSGVVDPKKTERIATLVRAELDDDLDPDDFEDAVATAIEGLSKDMPALFETGKRNAGSGDGGARGSSGKEGDDEADREKALIAEYAARGLRIPATSIN